MTRPRRRLWSALQAALAAVVVAAVGWHFVKLLRAADFSAAVVVRPGPLAAAALCYLAAHTLWGTYFWQLLRSQGAEVSWFTGVRAYFVSQAGKYVPGKAWVILIRIVLLRKDGLSPAVVGVCGTFETLTSMAAGAALGVLLLPWSGWGLAVGSTAWVGFLALATLPVALMLSTGGLDRLLVRRRNLTPRPPLRNGEGVTEGNGFRAGTRLINRHKVLPLSVSERGPGGEVSAPLPHLPVRLLALGLVQAAAGWGLLAVSMTLVMAALLPDPTALTGLDPRGVVAAVCLSYVAGFAALILPAGVGARDLLLQQMLAAQLTAVGVPGAAAVGVVAAVTTRLVWTAAEVVLAAGLWYAGRAAVPAERELAAVGGRA